MRKWLVMALVGYLVKRFTRKPTLVERVTPMRRRGLFR
jgi:hypothetical protein